MTTTVAANAVTVLQNETSASTGTSSAQRDIAVGPFTTDAVVHVSAAGRAAYKGGGGVNNGIVVEIFRDDTLLASDDSFEAAASNMTFRAAASHTFVAPKGKKLRVTGKVSQYGAGNHPIQDSRIELTVVALAAVVR